MVQLMHLYVFQTNVMQLNLVFTIFYFSEKRREGVEGKDLVEQIFDAAATIAELDK